MTVNIPVRRVHKSPPEGRGQPRIFPGSLDTTGWDAAGPIRNPRAARRGWHGRGLSRAGYAAPIAKSRSRFCLDHLARDRDSLRRFEREGQGDGVPLASQHSRRSTTSATRRVILFAGHGTARWARRFASACGARLCRGAARSEIGLGRSPKAWLAAARQRNHSPRPETGEHFSNVRRSREDYRILASRGWSRRDLRRRRQPSRLPPPRRRAP